MVPDTIFHKIIRREVPAEIVFENERLIAIRDINPQAPLHLLVIPKQTLPRLASAGDTERVLLGELMQVASRLAREQGFEDFRVVVNCGAKAGQSVDQLHLHVLAGREMRWPPG